MSLRHSPVLIVGAGPTGLAAALFLAEHHIRPRIIDKAPRPSETSRAQVVNPRSLELLETTGITARIRGEGRPLAGARFYDGWHDLAHLDFEDIHPRFPMTALPQARTEALLLGALVEHSIAPERGVTLTGFAEEEDGIFAELTRPDGTLETVQAEFLLGADGAHSTVRHLLGIEFEGSAFPEAWPLYDIQLETSLDGDHAHISFVDGGLIFMLHIEDGVWRVFGDVTAPLEYLPVGTVKGEILWQSSFHISHRLAAAETAGRVALAGDAAHIHSPVAARGMNLGIEDAYVFAECVRDALGGDLSRIADYSRLRHTVHAPVVRRIERLTWLARGQPSLVGTLRNHLLPGMTKFAPIAHEMLKLVTGLDHQVRVR
ncbi:MAG TPA: FAD-dependent monooxygenase [Stellaceae bacterium]|jgi:2-polyprenyl-6-methoxyphenol hydroxylase-like FAD-dependent oxidoreductase|nr:FAD-dependent monooxygenase [Stellaceae bacterium]